MKITKKIIPAILISILSAMTVHAVESSDFTAGDIYVEGTTDGITIDLNWTLENGNAPNGYRVLWSLDQYPVYPGRPNDYYDTLRNESSDSYTIDYFLNPGHYFVRLCIFDSEDNCVKFSNQLDFTITTIQPPDGQSGTLTSEEDSTEETTGDQPVSATQLTDIEGHRNQTAIEYLYDKEVISGYSDNTFQPDRTVNRAELLKILVGGKGINPSADQFKDCFPDVTNEWFASYVCYAKTAGWVEGYPDGSFKPAQEVNKAEAIKMLVNSQGITLPENLTEDIYVDVLIDDWFAPYVSAAKNLNLLEEIGSMYNPGEEMTRGGISENIYRAMYIKENELGAFPVM